MRVPRLSGRVLKPSAAAQGLRQYQTALDGHEMTACCEHGSVLIATCAFEAFALKGLPYQLRVHLLGAIAKPYKGEQPLSHSNSKRPTYSPFR